MVQLPPEVYSAIASYVTQRDLLTLSHTSHAFQRAAEPRIYESVVLRDVHSAFIACHAITVREGTRGPYVKRFILYQDPRRMLPRMNLNAVPPQFWLSVQQALKEMVNLEYVVIHDPLVSQSWVLGHEDIHFQALELNLRLQWDSHLVAFLQTQTKLHALLLGADAAAEDQDGPLCPLPVTALQTLEVFSGPLLVAAELLGCPLTRMQILVDQDTAPILPTVVSDLGKIMGTLRKLHIVGIPEALTLETVQLVSTSIFAPILRSLGVLPISVREVSARACFVSRCGRVVLCVCIPVPVNLRIYSAAPLRELSFGPARAEWPALVKV